MAVKLADWLLLVSNFQCMVSGKSNISMNREDNKLFCTVFHSFKHTKSTNTKQHHPKSQVY
jgi:hypothetical protein